MSPTCPGARLDPLKSIMQRGTEMNMTSNKTQSSHAVVVHAGRRTIQTYDVFDTLIARRCIEPHAIFTIVEERSGVQGYAAARITAERVVYQRRYTLRDIYVEMQKHLTLGTDELETLMHLEVQVELENVVPIQENLAALPSDACLITDTYLPKAVIQELLRQAGVRRDFPILLDSHGKSSGRVWKELREQGLQCVHLGDNEVSDLRNARAEGMRARLSQLSNPTAVEKALTDLGAHGVAQAMRVARLSVDRRGMPDWLYSLQMNLNVPFLLLSSVMLMSELRRSGAKKVLFASRDGRNLQSAFNALAAKFDSFRHIGSEYWYTSRLARVGRSASYLDYCAKVMDGPVLLADLCGTGTSIAALLKDLGPRVSGVGVFLAEQISESDYSRNMAQHYAIDPMSATADVQYAFNTQEFVPNYLLEELNYLPEGMVRDVGTTSFGHVPLRDAVDFDGGALALIANQHRMLSEFFAAFERELTEEGGQALVQVSSALFGWLHREQLTPARQREFALLQESIGVDDFANEAGTMRQLAACGRSSA